MHKLPDELNIKETGPGGLGVRYWIVVPLQIFSACLPHLSDKV